MHLRQSLSSIVVIIALALPAPGFAGPPIKITPRAVLFWTFVVGALILGGGPAQPEQAAPCDDGQVAQDPAEMAAAPDASQPPHPPPCAPAPIQGKPAP